MTKTTTVVAPYNCQNLFPTLRLLDGTDASKLQVWNFEFGSLEFVWILVLGI
jgi:hypothetical protein